MREEAPPLFPLTRRQLLFLATLGGLDMAIGSVAVIQAVQLLTGEPLRISFLPGAGPLTATPTVTDVLTSFLPKTATAAATQTGTPTRTLTPTLFPSPTLEPTATATAKPTEKPLIKIADVLHQPEAKQAESIKTLFADPRFFLSSPDSSGRIIMIRQRNPAEFARLADKNNLSLDEWYACGQSCIAMVRKTFCLLKTGSIPDLTPADVTNTFFHQSFWARNLTYTYVDSSNHGLKINALKPALASLDAQTQFYDIVNLTPAANDLARLSVEPANYADLFARARQEVLDQKGLVVIRSLQPYGQGGTPADHTSIISSLDQSGQALIIDSLGSDLISGSIQRMSLTGYLKGGLLSAFGVKLR